MEGLRRLSYDILDVKAQTWMDDFRQLKADLDNLGTMMTQVIEGAFEVVATVEGGAELLEAFHYLAKREELERAVDRRKNGVWRLFQKEVGFVQKELQKYSAGRTPPILFLHPPSAGHSFWYRTFRQRVESSYRLLQRCYYLESCPEKVEAVTQYNKLNLEDSVKKQYAAWKVGLPEHPSQYLENSLIARRERENDVTTFIVNFAPELTVLFEEARYWARLGEAIPPKVADICQREERLRVFRENVALAVRAYDNIVLSLTADERRLFACRIQYLDSKFASGMTKHTWSSQDTVVFYFMACLKSAGEVQDDVNKFKLGVQEILHLCKVISEIVAVSIEKKNTYTVEEFDRKQSAHREAISKKLAIINEMIVNIMRGLFEIFQADYATDPKIQVEWHKFVETIDKEMEDAHKMLVKKSWQEIERALGTAKEDDKSNEAPLFLLRVIAPDPGPGETKPTPTAEHLSSLSTKMVTIAKEVIGIVTAVPRLEEALSKAVESVPDSELTQKALPRVQHKSPFADAQFQGPYYDQGDSESMLFMKQIQSAFTAIGDKIRDQLEGALKLLHE
jgi:dynein heavy chain